jgi:NADP-dependent 3-hydroxy acid dehydrogenase YdfG
MSPFMKSTNPANWILVTGTSTGFGHATTFTLAENGYRVLAAVRKQEDIESLLAEAATRQVVGSVEPIILYVTDAGQISAAVEIVRAKVAARGRLHAIVHNAGAHRRGCQGRGQFHPNPIRAAALCVGARRVTQDWFRSSHPVDLPWRLRRRR